ncbi:hypothetical protein PsorP6_008947 [Peronosclerospora sorghi]|uniref:Uncharacterized protein n=1 Tax=Peronosclerospora sorghi TaxID=230839 RepID=A0ACC0W1U9_9STRA|nr:hypothetical protein PsorP6_008947 [Peronosclerospora sorghi]
MLDVDGIKFNCKTPQRHMSEYLDCLKYVAYLMTRNHVLLLFCANACPDPANTLILRIDRANMSFLSKADRILSLLVDLTETDEARPTNTPAKCSGAERQEGNRGKTATSSHRSSTHQKLN